MTDLIIYDPIALMMSMREDLEAIGALESQREPVPSNRQGGG